MRTKCMITGFLSMFLAVAIHAQNLEMNGDGAVNWVADEKEASLAKVKEDGTSVIDFKITVDHSRDKTGSTTGKSLMNWPRIRYEFPKPVNLGEYKNFQFEYKATISRKSAAFVPVFINFKSGAKAFDFHVKLKKNEGWRTEVIRVKDLLSQSKSTASDWNALKYIQIGIAERQFISGTKLNIKLKNIRLSKDKAKSLDKTLLTVLDIPFNKAVPEDLSKAKNTCALLGKAAVKDGALILNGNKSYANCGKKKDLDLGNGDITIFAKIKLAQKQTPRTGIVSKGAGSESDPGYVFVYRLPKKAFYFYVSDGSTRAGFTSKEMVLNDNKWHKVVVSVKRGEKIFFAVDGKTCTRKEQRIPNDNIIAPDRDLLIGSWSGAHFLNGAIKNVRIIKKAYSAKELAAMTE